MDKKDTIIDYEMDVEEDFKPINYELWGVQFEEDNIILERIIGFSKIIQSPYSKKQNLSYEQTQEKMIIWYPMIIEFGSLAKIETEFFCFGTPTKEKLQKISEQKEKGFDFFDDVCGSVYVYNKDKKLKK